MALRGLGVVRRVKGRKMREGVEWRWWGGVVRLE